MYCTPDTHNALEWTSWALNVNLICFGGAGLYPHSQSMPAHLAFIEGFLLHGSLQSANEFGVNRLIVHIQQVETKHVMELVEVHSNKRSQCSDFGNNVRESASTLIYKILACLLNKRCYPSVVICCRMKEGGAQSFMENIRGKKYSFNSA